ncbi:hypothetical protein PCE1_004846 [Barthelona sp. PCE]
MSDLKLCRAMDRYNDEQRRFMIEDQVIVINEVDEPLSSSTKWDAHQVSNPSLHRAFSILLIDENNELLLQKRACFKPTFPNLWTNTCCSHPLTPNEVNGLQGVQDACIRKLYHELGVPTETFSPADFKLSTKVLYMSPDETTGLNLCEYELDYIVVCRCTRSEVTVESNDNEVSDVRWITLADLVQEFTDVPETFTPWFSILVEHFLEDIMDKCKNSLDIVNDGVIHNFLPKKE